ncbi:protein-S-isoprenylcysteine O-methyltransferase Ste14 [Bradyrhizobium sp. USDA 4011]
MATETLIVRLSQRGSTMLKLPPPIWTLIYLLVGATLSWWLGWPTLPGLPIPLLGIALVVIAFIAPVWAFVLFRREGTEIEPTSPTNRVLVTSGPYRFTRNPMYSGLVLLVLGIAVWVGAWPMFIVPVAVFATANWVHIPFEETKMRRQFGAAYDDYVARVRRWV